MRYAFRIPFPSYSLRLILEVGMQPEKYVMKFSSHFLYPDYVLLGLESGHYNKRIKPCALIKTMAYVTFEKKK